jgi:uncharacterized membrane protein
MAEDREATYHVKGLERLIGLTDDVFAFAITLLVLELVTPVVIGPASNTSLAAALASEYQSFIDLAVSFWVASLLWLAHHRIFRYIKGCDTGLLTLNLLFLFFIVLIPFATRVLDSYDSLQVAMLVFTIPLIGANLMNASIWRYACSSHLVDERTPQRTMRWLLVRGPVGAAMFAVSVLLAFIHPDVAFASWFAIPPALVLLDRRYGEKPVSSR